MDSKEFVQKYYPFAVKIENVTGIPALAIMAQAALESGWGKKSIGNNIFGIKFKKGDKSYRKVLTTEYTSSPFSFKGQEVVSKVYLKDVNKFKYKVYQYFADYDSVLDCFKAHSKLLLSDRYKHCLRWKHSPKRYLIAIWRSGYATDINYGKKMCEMVDSIKRRL